MGDGLNADETDTDFGGYSTIDFVSCRRLPTGLAEEADELDDEVHWPTSLNSGFCSVVRLRQVGPLRLLEPRYASS